MEVADAAVTVIVQDTAPLSVGSASAQDPFAVPHEIVGVGGADNATYTSWVPDHPDHKYPSYARVRTHPCELSANAEGVHDVEVPADTYPVVHKLVHDVVDDDEVNQPGPSPRIVDTVVVDYAAVGSVVARWAS